MTTAGVFVLGTLSAPFDRWGTEAPCTHLIKSPSKIRKLRLRGHPANPRPHGKREHRRASNLHLPG